MPKTRYLRIIARWTADEDMDIDPDYPIEIDIENDISNVLFVLLGGQIAIVDLALSPTTDEMYLRQVPISPEVAYLN